MSRYRLLTKYLLEAGHSVIATDASPAMLDLARQVAPDADIRELVLPDDPLPNADAIVSIGHVLSYLPDEAAIEPSPLGDRHSPAPGRRPRRGRRPGMGSGPPGRPKPRYVSDDWAIITEFSIPSPNHFVREMTTFILEDSGSWRRDHERHDNVLIDTQTIPSALADVGVQATVGTSFGTETLPTGLRVVTGQKPA